MKRKGILLFLFIFATHYLLADFDINKPWKFQLHTNTDGLSNSSITCLYQDSLMRVWIGTWDGLNVYNGNSFNVFKFEHNSPNTLSNNIVRDIVEVQKGVIWVATDYGINRIHTADNTIERYYPGYETSTPTVENAFSIAATEEGDLFCAVTGWGMAYYDEAMKRMTALNIPIFNTTLIRDIFYVGGHHLLLYTTQQQLYQLHFTREEDGTLAVNEPCRLLTPSPITAVFSKNRTLFCVSDAGVISKYDANQQSLRQQCVFGKGQTIKALAPISDDALIFATDEPNTYVYSYTDNAFSAVPQLSGLNILSLLMGTQDIVWVGTDGQGLLEIYEDNNAFVKVTNLQMFKTKSSPVRCFYQGDDGTLYVGTKGNGIYVQHPDGTNRVIATQEGLRNLSVYALVPGPDHHLLIGHDGVGLDMLSLETGLVTPLLPQTPNAFQSVYAISYDQEDGCIWAGTNGFGLVKITLGARSHNTYEMESYVTYVNDKNNETSLSNNSIFSLAPAGDDKMWVGTRGGGLDLLHIHSGTFTHFTATQNNSPLSSNDVLSVYPSNDSTLWLGTSYGLNKLTWTQTGQYACTWYIEKNGLPNNTIHGVLEDEKGFLWMSTNKGLSKLNPTTNELVNYYNNPDLQDNEFSDGAFYKNAEGILFFGGINGYNYFRPSKIQVRDYEPRVAITDFMVKQKPLLHFTNSQKVTLAHKDNFFSVNFSALEFIDNSQCEYEYKLEGFDKEWVKTSSNSANYTNVPPGEYVLKVRCTNGDKIWSSYNAVLAITVKAPWWQTGWAYFGYFLLFVGAAYLSWWVYKERTEQRHKLEMEALNRSLQTKTHEAKLSFFTNVAHEFCTPLTLIFGSSELLLSQNHSPENSKRIKSIYDNAKRMQRLIWELMEFRKAESGVTKPQYSFVHLQDILRPLVDSYTDLNGEHNIDLSCQFTGIEGPIVSDVNALEKILINLISNAYKYTPDKGYIRLQVEQQASETRISITNSGKGIKEEDLATVFNRYRILDNLEVQAKKGNIMRNGIGLALAQSLASLLQGVISVSSIPNKETTFTLSLPTINPADVQIQIEQEATKVDFSQLIPAETTVPPAVPHSKSQVIMVVDDEPQIRALITEVLSNEYQIVEAADGQEVIDFLKRDRPNLIISDICMPNVDGIELLKYLKSNEITSHIPLVFLTYKNDIEDKVCGYEMGGDAYIPKPFHPAHLKAVVHQLLASRSLLKEYYNSSLSTSDVYSGNVVDAEDKKFMVQLTKLIEDNMTDEHLSPEFICEKLFISHTQLYRKLKDISQMTPSEFIRKIRLERAAHQLATTTLTVQEIMYLSGFNNKSYFYREFAKVYHVTPSEYRNKDGEK